MLTLMEVLVKPFREQNEPLAQEYRDLLLHSRGLSAIAVSGEVLEEAARLRAVYTRLRPPDAIQLATAKQGGAGFFLTNDRRLPALPELPTLILDDLQPG